MLVIVGIMGFIFFRGHTSSSVEKIGQTGSIKPAEHLVASGKLPSLFPKEIPVELGINVSQSGVDYSQTSGFYLQTYEFDSVKNLEDNYNFYLSALEKNGWDVFLKKPASPNSAEASVYGRKDKKLFMAVMTQKSKTSPVRVKIQVMPATNS